MALNTAQQGELVNALVKGGYGAAEAQNAASNSGGRAEELYREYLGGNKSTSTSSSGGGNSASYTNTASRSNLTRQDIETAFQRSGIGRGPTDSEYALYLGNPWFTDAGRVEGDIRAGGGGRTYQDSVTEPMRKAVEQGTQALEGQKSLISQSTAQEKTRLQTEQSSLEQRYANIIDDMKANTDKALTRTRGVTEAELANRGINLQGNAAQTEITQNLNPINESLNTSLRDVAQAREDDIFQITNLISQLPISEKQQMLAVEQAIAQLKMQGAQFDANQALQMAQLQLLQAKDAREAQLQDFNINSSVAQAPLALQLLQGSITAQQLANQKAKAATSTNTTGTANWQDEVNRILTGGQSVNPLLNGPAYSSNMSTPPSYFTPITTFQK